jgi:hypothetical protein
VDGGLALWVFDPTKAVGQANPAAVDTGQTAISQLSATVTNGVVYAAGRRTDHRQPGNRPGFAVNVDQATQALRDLIVESQLMQDFDEPRPGRPTPPRRPRPATRPI